MGILASSTRTTSIVVCLVIMFAAMSQSQKNGTTTVKPNPNTTEPVDTALRCYACYGIGPNNECDNYTNFVKAWKSDNQQYGSIRLKRCSAPYNITCIINTYVNKNGEISHIRDCSDGVTFGFPKDKKDRYKALLNLTNDNYTKCAWDGQEMVCLTKCNHPNFCNGPQLAASTCSLSLAAALASLVMWLCVHDGQKHLSFR